MVKMHQFITSHQLVEQGIEHENGLMVHLIKHMVETGVLRAGGKAEDAAQASIVW